MYNIYISIIHEMNVSFSLFQDTEHIGDVYQDETNQAAMLLYRDKTDDALLMVSSYYHYLLVY